MLAVRLCIISDLHLSSNADRINIIADRAPFSHRRVWKGFFQTTHCSDLPQKIGDFLEANHQRHDAVIALGDLACTGFTEDLDFARAFCLSNYPIGTTLPNLMVPKEKLLAIPGNHDRYQFDGSLPSRLAEAVAPGNRNFDTYFKENWTARTLAVAPFNSIGGNAGSAHQAVAWFKIPGSNQMPNIYLAAADFCLRHRGEGETWRRHRAKLGFAGQGKAHADVLSTLVNLTEEIKRHDDNSTCVWLLHFPPVPLDKINPKERNLRLIDADDVLRAAARCKIGLILSGHMHRHDLFLDGAPTEVWCAGSAAVASAEFHYLYEIEVHADVVKRSVQARRTTFVHKQDPELGYGFYPEPVAPALHSWSY